MASLIITIFYAVGYEKDASKSKLDTVSCFYIRLASLPFTICLLQSSFCSRNPLAKFSQVKFSGRWRKILILVGISKLLDNWKHYFNTPFPIFPQNNPIRFSSLWRREPDSICHITTSAWCWWDSRTNDWFIPNFFSNWWNQTMFVSFWRRSVYFWSDSSAPELCFSTLFCCKCWKSALHVHHTRTKK